VDTTRVDGLAATNSLFDRIPQAAREQLGVEMARIGYDVLAAQKQDVAKKTGDLETGLSLKLMIDRLRVMVGLLNLTGARSRLFYGRIVERGRRAQTVLVERRRRVSGKLRLGPGRRKRAQDIATVYAMKVPALPPRPFIYVERPEIHAEQRLANFWSTVLGNVGASA
jgi:hypothetical protein